jgi:DNA (cytosine-5)-methyltransferase 1
VRKKFALQLRKGNLFQMSLVAIDLFCGCGGVTRGFSDAGVRVDVGIDFDENCKATYERNNKKSKFILDDVTNLSGRDLLKHIGRVKPGDKLLLSACAPCQPFSQQNRNKRIDSERRVLTQVARLVRELEPDFVFLENVYGLKNVPGYSAFRRLLNTLSELGYKTESDMVDASDFGVPQTRKRFVLTAVRDGESVWPRATHGPDLKAYTTVRQAIEKFPRLKHGQRHRTVPNHIAAALSELNLRRIKATPRNGGSRTQWPNDLKLACHSEHDGHPDVYGRLQWDAPAPTLTTKCTSLSNGRYGHPEQHRAISAKEAAAIQGFRRGYVFVASIDVLRRLIGNAVPPPVAKHFGLAFLERAKEKSTRVPKWRKLVQNSKRLRMKTRESNLPAQRAS